MTKTLMDRQIELEDEMASRGADAFRKLVADAKADGRESTTPYGSTLVRRAIAPVAAEIKEFLATTSAGHAGRHHVAAKYLRDIDPEVAAFVALRSCLNLVSTRFTLQNGAMTVASALEMEVRLAAFEAANGREYRNAAKHLEHSSNEHYKETVFTYAAGKHDVALPSWPKRDKVIIGQKLIEIVADTTGYIEIAQDYRSKAATGKHFNGAYTYHVVGTPRCLEWIGKLEEYTALAASEYLPAIVSPKPWKGPYGGGYYSLFEPLKLVKTGNSNYLEELFLATDDMPVLYEALNAMQSTGYAINTPVLEVMHRLWESGGIVAGLPNREAYTLPFCPVCGKEIPPYQQCGPGEKHPCLAMPEHADTLQAWKKEAALTYERNIAMLSKRIQFAKILWLADKFKTEAAIYFPMQLDFRGRVYTLPAFLNPQGNDPAKALLRFSEGKPLNAPEAMQWLAIHGANTFGEDKISLEERQAWVIANESAILATAANPYDNRWWHDADKPWQFLAFCFEWAAYKRAENAGETFISSLPVSMDGSCNGLQIFSLMLRDPIGGEATNLLPAPRPQDIYQIVADKTKEELIFYADNGVIVTRKDGESEWYDEKDLARRLLAFGINRKTTKRQVMVLPYGGTFQACCEYTLEHLQGRLDAGEGSEETIHMGNAWAASRFLANLIWQSIDSTVIAARAAMNYLQNLASIVASEGLPVNWSTPIGFLVSQAYYDMREFRVKTRLGASTIRLILREEGEEKTIDTRRQRNGISPNFVHSLDAAAMCESIHLASLEGVSSFMMIHDSYGTHAADAAILARCLRRAFVTMFTERDVLADLRDEVAAMLPEGKVAKLPPLPPKGNLDVTKVLQSAFFFA